MTSMNPAPPPELSEDGVAAASSLVRAETVRRLETLYELTQTQIHLAEEVGRPVDPRWAELAVRILRETAGIFRLHKPVVVVEEETRVEVPVDEIEAQLKELEAKAQG